MVDIIRRCQNSASFFIDTFGKVQHPKAGAIPFKLFSYQKKCLKEYRENRWVIFRKVRQSGISTLTGAYALWYAMFFPNKTVLIVSKRDDDAMAFLRRNIKFFYDELPDWMKEMWPLQDANGLPLDNEHMIGFPNGSRITSLTSGPETLRSNASSLNIIDEAAFIMHMSTMWAGAAPTLSHGGSVIVISTCNGIGNWYEQTYNDAIEGNNTFHPIVINWWEMDWTIKFKDELTRKTVEISPLRDVRECKTPEEQKRYGKYWSPWLEEQYRSLVKRGGEALFRQEILADFLGSGNTVLPRNALMYISTTVSDDYKPINTVSYVNPVTGNQEYLEFGGCLWLWKHTGSSDFAPVKNFQYLIGADPSTGEGSDPSAMVVWCVNTREQVAEFSGKVLPNTFAKMVDYVGRAYNNALVVPERTGLGSSFCQDLNNMVCYPNLYRQEMVTAKKTKFGKVGFPTSPSTKPTLNKTMLDFLVPSAEWEAGEAEDSGCFKIRSTRLKKEFEIYVNLSPQKTGAEPGTGNHDDLVISSALGLLGINQSISHGSSTLTPYNEVNHGVNVVDIPAAIDNAVAQGIVKPDVTTNAVIPIIPSRYLEEFKTPEQELRDFMSQMSGGVFTDDELRDRMSPVKNKKHKIVKNK